MKTTLSTFILATSLAVADPSNYINFIRQIQDGFEWDISVAASGTMTSASGINEQGSLFRLYSVHTTLGIDYLLDEEFVSTYTPDPSIEIVTGDPYQPIPRTRVDQPFTVNIRLKGMLSGKAGAPDVARKVLLTHEAFNYPEGKHTLEGIDNPPAIEVGTSFLTENKRTILNYSTNHLTAPDLTKAEGEEVWTIHTLDPTGARGEVLESQKLQIWPIADAVISGIDSTERYGVLPPITVKYNDLYPSSETMVRIYKGPPVADATQYTEIIDAFWKAVDSVPESPPAKVLTNLDSLFTEEGSYTMEVIHHTPFGSDILTQFYPIQIDRTVEVRGGLYTIE